MAAKLAEEATAMNPYLLEAWYQLALWSVSDLKATNRLLARLDTLMLDPSKAAAEGGDLSATTDFNKLKLLKGGADPKRDSTLVANMVAPAIVESVYSPLVSDKRRQKEAFAMLKEAAARRDALKMPYGGGVRDLLLKLEVASEGPRSAQQRMEKSVAAWPKVEAKRRGKAAPDLADQISAVATGLPDAKARVAWLARLQRGMPSDLTVSKAKDGKMSVDPLYKSLHDLQVRELRSLGKAGADDLKRLNAAWKKATEG